jgi:hypothetical protein
MEFDFVGFFWKYWRIFFQRKKEGKKTLKFCHFKGFFCPKKKTLRT